MLIRIHNESTISSLGILILFLNFFCGQKRRKVYRTGTARTGAGGLCHLDPPFDKYLDYLLKTKLC